jgi:hypothetical protein
VSTKTYANNVLAQITFTSIEVNVAVSAASQGDAGA